MKRLIIIILSLTLALSTWAEDTAWDWSNYRHNISINYGSPSLYPISLDFFKIFTIIPLIAEKNRDSYSCYGHFSIQYHYHCLSWLRVGAKADWEGRHCYAYEDKNKTIRQSHIMDQQAALMASCQFTYLNRQHVQLYSGIDLGVLYWNTQSSPVSGKEAEVSGDKTQDWLFAFNATLFGVNAGGEHVYALGEINVGADAILKAGIGVRF